MNAKESNGANNTSAAWVHIIKTSILEKPLKEDLFKKLDMEDLLYADDNIINTPEEECDQSATQKETLLHCEVCDLLIRDKIEFLNHKTIHPTCNTCNKIVNTKECLEEHMLSHDNSENIQQSQVEKDFAKALEAPVRKTKAYKRKPSSTDGPNKKLKSIDEKKAKKPLNSFMLYCQENREAMKLRYPELGGFQIQSKLAIEWKIIPEDDRMKYKQKADDLKTSTEIVLKLVDCAFCEQTFDNKVTLRDHMNTNHGILQSSQNKLLLF